MKKHFKIEWLGKGTTITVAFENITTLDVASVLLSLATNDADLGSALLLASDEYKNIKPGGKLIYCKEVKKNE